MVVRVGSRFKNLVHSMPGDNFGGSEVMGDGWSGTGHAEARTEFDVAFAFLFLSAICERN